MNIRKHALTPALIAALMLTGCGGGASVQETTAAQTALSVQETTASRTASAETAASAAGTEQTGTSVSGTAAAATGTSGTAGTGSTGSQTTAKETGTTAAEQKLPKDLGEAKQTLLAFLDAVQKNNVGRMQKLSNLDGIARLITEFYQESSSNVASHRSELVGEIKQTVHQDSRIVRCAECVRMRQIRQDEAEMMQELLAERPELAFAEGAFLREVPVPDQIFVFHLSSGSKTSPDEDYFVVSRKDGKYLVDLSTGYSPINGMTLHNRIKDKTAEANSRAAALMKTLNTAMARLNAQSPEAGRLDGVFGFGYNDLVDAVQPKRVGSREDVLNALKATVFAANRSAFEHTEGMMISVQSGKITAVLLETFGTEDPVSFEMIPVYGTYPKAMTLDTQLQQMSQRQALTYAAG
ncbi:MAG: hypothetical protein IK107_03935 [Oscillospiraceae bacterium]|nr:hypothetical protein [Oscillospiraceae bacterium]